MKKFGDIRDDMPPACPNTGYDCGKKECDPANGKCGFPPDPPGRSYKVWGTTTPRIVTPMFEMHHLNINPWHQCSIHTHRFKSNAFYVLDGVLYVDVWRDGPNDRSPAIKLVAGADLTIPPNIRHRFRTGSAGAQALEMYFTEPLSEDIQRQNEGSAIPQVIRDERAGQ